METIQSKEEWDWYLRKLDADAKYNHDHRGQPKSFPCKVESTWGDEPNGPYFYSHRFIYQTEKACQSCGHKHKEWDA